MRLAVCLHAGAVTRSALRLHSTDARAIALGAALGEVVAVENVGQRGVAPVAVLEAMRLGANRAVRMVDPALDATDAQTTGFVLASVLHRLEVDMVLFGGDADPEGIGDVPAQVAHHMGALYLTDAVHIGPAPGGGEGVRAGLRAGAWLRQVDLPLNAVVGLAAWPQPPAANGDGAAAGVGQALVDVLSLADFKIDPADVRRRNDLRGVAEPAPRPLVTLHSRAALAALLRPSS